MKKLIEFELDGQPVYVEAEISECQDPDDCIPIFQIIRDEFSSTC